MPDPDNQSAVRGGPRGLPQRPLPRQDALHTSAGMELPKYQVRNRMLSIDKVFKLFKNIIEIIIKTVTYKDFDLQHLVRRKLGQRERGHLSRRRAPRCSHGGPQCRGRQG